MVPFSAWGEPREGIRESTRPSFGQDHVAPLVLAHIMKGIP